MTTTARKLITLVAEAGLENRLVQMVQDQGARGYTVSTAHGEGPRGGRASDISGGNIRIETVVTREAADKILEVLEKDYFPHYAVTCWLSDVEIVREDRY
jgi:nitrogen regulatory protein P-II 2